MPWAIVLNPDYDPNAPPLKAGVIYQEDALKLSKLLKAGYKLSSGRWMPFRGIEEAMEINAEVRKMVEDSGYTDLKKLFQKLQRVDPDLRRKRLDVVHIDAAQAHHAGKKVVVKQELAKKMSTQQPTQDAKEVRQQKRKSAGASRGTKAAASHTKKAISSQAARASVVGAAANASAALVKSGEATARKPAAQGRKVAARKSAVQGKALAVKSRVVKPAVQRKAVAKGPAAAGAAKKQRGANAAGRK